jgi:hypothetical protein
MLSLTGAVMGEKDDPKMMDSGPLPLAGIHDVNDVSSIVIFFTSIPPFLQVITIYNSGLQICCSSQAIFCSS